MTLATTYSWAPVGEPLQVAYEAPQGRRVNAIGAYFTHGSQAGAFYFETYASLPASRSKKAKRSVTEQAEAHGVRPEEVGRIDSERFLAFVWKVAGRPAVHAAGWQRERELVIVLDNYSVHKSEAVREALPELASARVTLWYLPAYTPELSAIEPVWQDVKHHQLRKRSYAGLGELKPAADLALERKARALRRTGKDSTYSLRRAA